MGWGSSSPLMVYLMSMTFSKCVVAVRVSSGFHSGFQSPSLGQSSLHQPNSIKTFPLPTSVAQRNYQNNQILIVLESWDWKRLPLIPMDQHNDEQEWYLNWKETRKACQQVQVQAHWKITNPLSVYQQFYSIILTSLSYNWDSTSRKDLRKASSLLFPRSWILSLHNRRSREWWTRNFLNKNNLFLCSHFTTLPIKIMNLSSLAECWNTG